MRLQESELKKSIKKYLDARHIYYENRSGSTQIKGIPDMFMVVEGHHIELELKAPDGILSTAQLKWVERFNSYGVPCYSIRNIFDLQVIIATYSS